MRNTKDAIKFFETKIESGPSSENISLNDEAFHLIENTDEQNSPIKQLEISQKQKIEKVGLLPYLEEQG